MLGHTVESAATVVELFAAHRTVVRPAGVRYPPVLLQLAGLTKLPVTPAAPQLYPCSERKAVVRSV